MFQPWAKNLEMSLQNEPENDEFIYKLQYDMKLHPVGSGDDISWLDNINYISLMESGCTGCPNCTSERL